MGDLSLDVGDVQVLVNFPNDGQGFFWHHRVLLCRVAGSRWLTLTPDLEIAEHDLGQLRHRVLPRLSPFPPDIAGEVYAFDPVGVAVLNGFKRQAKTMAIILGEGDLPDSEATCWVRSDTRDPDFGVLVDSGLLENAATGLAFGAKGVAVIEGEEVFVERVPTKELAAWKRGRLLEGGDTRLLGDHRDASGQRRLDLATSVMLMKSAEEADFPIKGTRAAKELHNAVSEGPGNFLSYHAEWVRLSGVSRRSAATHVHSALCEGLRLLHHYDQIDSSSTAIGEHLSRWLIQTEIAVERSPQQPDYSGLDIIAGTAVLPDGRASTGKFNEWVSSRMKERAAIWKQERLYRQERRAGRLNFATQADEDDEESVDKGAGKGKRRKKKKGDKTKPDDSSGGAPGK